MTAGPKSQSKSVGLFVTCLVDLFRPGVGFAAVKLLEDAGCSVSVPETQTCCGQPAYNSGDRADTMAIAKSVVEAFEPFDYIVAPSGSCAAMIKKHYPPLFQDDPQFQARENIATVEDDELGGPVRMQNVVGKFSETPGEITSAGPKLGAHNREVLIEQLGFTEDELKEGGLSLDS